MKQTENLKHDHSTQIPIQLTVMATSSSAKIRAE
jgi:hypothetical protein